MRTALVLLFLLALAALPGALLPQRSLNQRLVDQYFADHPTLAPAARPARLLRRLRRALVRRGLPAADDLAGRLPAAAHARARPRRCGPRRWRPRATSPGCRTTPSPRSTSRSARPPARVAQPAAGLAGRRVDGPGRPAPDVSAEKGYLREVGNLRVPPRLLGLLVAFAAGKLFGYEGQVIVLSGGGQFCNTGILGYDSFRAGPARRRHRARPVLRRVDDFTATYQPNGPARGFRADHRLPDRRGPRRGPDDLAADDARGQPPAAARRRAGSTCSATATRRASPSPSRTASSAPARSSGGPVDQTTLLSEGATKFARPA